MNNSVKIVIVEDELIIAEELKEKLKSFGYEVFDPVDNAQDAIKLINEVKPDVVLLDINIDGNIDGIELAYRISEKEDLAIIFLTALSDEKTLSRAKKLKPAAYIIKPYDDRNLAVAIDLAFSNISDLGEENEYLIKDSFFIKEHNKFLKIKLDDILYLEAKGSYSVIVTTEKSYTLSINLKNISSKISNPNLYRVHRSFVINTDKIEAFDGSQVIIKNQKIPIASSYKDEFLKRFKFI